jgi:hypothetical protein
MEPLMQNLNRWSTEKLVEEVIRRSASDGPALQLLEKTVINARLAEGDRRFGGGTQPELAAAGNINAELELVGVGGTTEMRLAAGEE